MRRRAIRNDEARARVSWCDGITTTPKHVSRPARHQYQRVARGRFPFRRDDLAR